jgi:hypothetical protein
MYLVRETCLFSFAKQEAKLQAKVTVITEEIFMTAKVAAKCQSSEDQTILVLSAEPVAATH